MSLSHDYVDDQNNTPKKKVLETTSPVNDVLSAETLTEETVQDEEFVNLATKAASVMWPELVKTAERALDVSDAVDQINRMNDHDKYQRAIDAIFDDTSLSTEEKLRLKAEEDERQNQKDMRATDRVKQLQESQSSVIVKIFKHYGRLIGLGAGVYFLFGTKTGRTILSKTAIWAAKEAPRLLRMVAA